MPIRRPNPGVIKKPHRLPPRLSASLAGTGPTAITRDGLRTGAVRISHRLGMRFRDGHQLGHRGSETPAGLFGFVVSAQHEGTLGVAIPRTAKSCSTPN
jgi:hypothetical protein